MVGVQGFQLPFSWTSTLTTGTRPLAAWIFLYLRKEGRGGGVRQRAWGSL